MELESIWNLYENSLQPPHICSMIDSVAIHQSRKIDNSRQKIYDTSIVNLIMYFINKCIILGINFDFLISFFSLPLSLVIQMEDMGGRRKGGAMQNESFYILKCRKRWQTIRLIHRVELTATANNHRSTQFWLFGCLFWQANIEIDKANPTSSANPHIYSCVSDRIYVMLKNFAFLLLNRNSSHWYLSRTISWLYSIFKVGIWPIKL